MVLTQALAGGRSSNTPHSEYKYMDRKSNLAHLERVNERLLKQLAELDRMAIKKGARTTSNLDDIEEMATGVSRRLCSIPEQDDGYYLDAYHLQIVQEKLEKEIASIKSRALRTGVKISNVDREMTEREEQAWRYMMYSRPGNEESVKGRQAGEKQKQQIRYQYQEPEWETVTLEYSATC